MLIIRETEYPANITEFINSDKLRLNIKFTTDFRIRKIVHDKVAQALNYLPAGYGFIIYEAFRPIERQIELWEGIWARLSKEHPEWDKARLTDECDVFVANPYTKGSGHQSAAAIDITLFDLDSGNEIDMGTAVQEFCSRTKTENPHITPIQHQHRQILRTALEKTGLINYSDEWWHYSYGDRLWGEITGARETFFDRIP